MKSVLSEFMHKCADKNESTAASDKGTEKAWNVNCHWLHTGGMPPYQMFTEFDNF